MNSTVRQPAAVDIATTAAKQSRTPKEQSTDDGRFMNMFSDAINSKAKETVKPQETEKESTSAVNESEAPRTQETQREDEASAAEQDDTSYEQQAAAAAMQMQGMFPTIVTATEPEDEEIIEMVMDEMADMQPLDAAQTITAAQTEAVAAEMFQAQTAQDITGGEVKTENSAAENPQLATATAETQMLAKSQESAAPRTARTEEAAPDIEVKQEPQTEQRQTIQQQDTMRQSPEAGAEQTDTNGEAEALRSSRPVIQTQHTQSPEEAAQAKFDDMLARASRELNQNAAVQETEAELPEETPIAGQPVVLEAKPQEAGKQAETVKAETTLPEDAKPTEQTTVQKSAKAPVTEQKPQKEISEADEALLGMTQQKQPEIKQEIIRNEPAPQPPQPVKTPDQAEQIKTQVIRSMENERTEFQMQLQPEELGKVNVKMILEGGKLSVEIAAVNPKSVEMLSKQAESLAASLKASGADVSSVNVVAATENASAEMNGEFNLNNFQNRFQNGESGQSGHGRRGGTGGTGGQGEGAAQAEREAPKAPQRILNYSV